MGSSLHMGYATTSPYAHNTQSTQTAAWLQPCIWLHIHVVVTVCLPFILCQWYALYSMRLAIELHVLVIPRGISMYDLLCFDFKRITVVPRLSEPLLSGTFDYLNSSEAMFYYDYHSNLQDGGSLVALWQL